MSPSARARVVTPPSSAMDGALGFLSSLLDRGLGRGQETTDTITTRPVNTYGSDGSDGSDGAKTRRRARPAAPKPTLSEEDERRSTYIENAKYLLITCVVWVHALDDFLATATIVNAESASVRRTKLDVMEPALPWIRALYLTLATFSMPLFTALAGFQSKSWLEIARGYDANASVMLARVQKSTSMLIGGWVFWQALYVAVSYSDVSPLQWWSPVGVTWFLIALWVWRNSVLLLGALRDSTIYAIVRVLAIAVGFTDTPSTKNGLAFLDWQRVCAYAIYFYAGLVLVKREHVDEILRRFMHLSRPWMRFAAGYGVLGVVFGAFMLSDVLGEPFGEVQEWLLVVSPYGVTKWYHPIIEALWRVVLYLVVALASVAFMSVVPTEEYFFTELGSRTLTAYLLHRVFLTTYTDITTKFWDDDDIDVAFQITMGVFMLPLLVSQVCLTRAVTTFCAPLVDPASRMAETMPWIFHARYDAYDTTEEEEIIDVAARDGIETPLDPTDRDVARSWRSGE